MSSGVTENICDENQNSLKRIGDIQSIDDLDFDKLDLTFGDTPEDINNKCLQLCKDYLSGNWTQQTLDTIEVRRVSGGLTNQLYYCGIRNPLNKSDVPQEVAIRLYGSKHFNKGENPGNERLTDTIISIMISENKLGPKIYGLFESGQIQQFYHHRQFKPEEQKDPKLVTEVFQKLARIHAMDVPIRRGTIWFINDMYESYKWTVDNSVSYNQWLDEYNCKLLKECDFKAHIEYIKDLCQKSESPVVFTHNDFRSSNLMITDTSNNPGDQIVVCDFEYASYGLRGFDFVSILSEWGRKQFDFKSIDGLPQDDSVFNPLVEIYVKECQRIYGKEFSKNRINSVEHIVKEIKIFQLIWTFFGSILIIKTITTSKIFSTKLAMEMAENSFKNYLILKERLRNLKVID